MLEEVLATPEIVRSQQVGVELRYIVREQQLRERS
jgi:hypothetical protein